VLTTGFQVTIYCLRNALGKGIKGVQDSKSFLATRFQRVLGFSNVHTRKGGLLTMQQVSKQHWVSAMCMQQGLKECWGSGDELETWFQVMRGNVHAVWFKWSEFSRISGNAGFQ
jgi:hypothetical protein